jgi:5-methyltetrahydropteroyltriglutamate--homocysteine methyltransferase
MSLPPLVTTSVGGLPPPPALLEARLGHARGEIAESDLAQAAREAAAHWIRVQERLGLDVLVDPAPLRDDMVCRFTDALAGFEPGGLVRTYANSYRRKPVCSGPVEWRGPITVAAWQDLQALTTRPLKATLTGPYTLMDWSFCEYYPDRAAACLAIARALREEVAALAAAGARIVQIDEPALARSRGASGLAHDALRVLLAGVDAYAIVHTCRETVSDDGRAVLELPVDNVDVALTRNGDDAVQALADLPAGLHLSLGALAAHRSDVPAAEELARRLRPIVAVRPLETLWITPDCRLEHSTPEVAEAQLAALVDAARLLRGESSVPSPPSAPTPPKPAVDDYDPFGDA